MKRDITFLALGGGSLLLSFFAPAALPVNPAWLAILLCGAPIVREAAVGLFTRFDIKADVLVSLALLASVAIGEIFAANLGGAATMSGDPPNIIIGTSLGLSFWDFLRNNGVICLIGLVLVLGDRRRGGEHPRQGRGGGGPAAGAPRRDHSGGRGGAGRTDLRQPGGDDRRVPPGGQGAGGRGIQRHRQPVRLL